MLTPRGSRTPSRKRKLCFSAAPVVHEYDTNSPSKRRLEVKRANSLDDIRSDDLQIEMEMRGLDNPRGGSQATLFLQVVNKELKDELAMYGLGGQLGNNKQLAEKVDLANFLRRRAHIRTADLQDKYLEGQMPADLTTKRLDRELEKRRIVLPESRIDKVVALEEALLKENEGLIGDGYDFGRRFVSVEDVLVSEEKSDKDLRLELQNRGVSEVPRSKKGKVDLLHNIIEKRLEKLMREYFTEELIQEVKRRGLVPELLAKYPDVKSNMKQIGQDLENIPGTKILEIVNTTIRHQHVHPIGHKTGPRKRKLQQVEGIEDETTEQVKAIDLIFDYLYSSLVWKKDYEDVPDTHSICSIS